jgi:hypothetical protein
MPIFEILQPTQTFTKVAKPPQRYKRVYTTVKPTPYSRPKNNDGKLIRR